MMPPAPLQPISGRRFFRILLYFSIPLVALFVLFNFWRASVHGDGGVCSDLVCSFTERHGDMLPIVASFTAEASKRAAAVNVALARELLLFNFIIGITYTILAAGVFCFAFPTLNLIGTFNPGRTVLAILLSVGVLAFMVYWIGWTEYWPGPRRRGGIWGRLIFSRWAGIFAFNGRSLLLLATTLLFIFYLFNVAAYMRREFRIPTNNRR